MARIVVTLLIALLLNSVKAASQLSLKPVKDSVGKKILIKPLPQNFYNHTLGYFCKKEIQLQKMTSLPIYVRLGSREHVDYLEGKPNSIKKE